MSMILAVLNSAWQLFLESAPYVVFGLLLSGLIKTWLTRETIARHLGQGTVGPVVKAALFGVPLPLCSCGVLPAALTLRQQGANRGATTAFLIATPESGVDSIAVSYALLDPFLTWVRPVAALCCAIVAGIVNNLFTEPQPARKGVPLPLTARAPRQTLWHGLRDAFTHVWQDMAGWFFFGLLLAGMISALVPQRLIETWLGGGVSSLLIMLVIGIPVYICASASTPIAAALILQGTSPGAALVFLLAGPATNVTSLTVLLSILGKRATAIYLLVVGGGAVLFGYVVDRIYLGMAWSPQAGLGSGAQLVSDPIRYLCAAILLLASWPLIAKRLRAVRPGGSPS